MGNFLVIAPARGFAAEGSALFQSGLAAAQSLRGQAPRHTAEAPWARAASFARANGTGGNLAQDPATKSWCLAVGSWFHSHGDASGDEARLLARYLEAGAEPLARELDGFFVVVVGDGRTNEVIVLTDRIGSCHAFVRRSPHGVAISGSSMLLAALGDATLDPVACQEFLRTGIVYEDRTLFREARKLGPARVAVFADGAARGEERYWTAADVEPDSLGDGDAVARLAESLSGAARRVGRTYERPACDLTGGYDSRLVVAGFLAARVPFSAVVAGPAESADVRVSRSLARLVNVPHVHVPPRARTSFAELKAALPWADGEYELVDCARVVAIHRLLAERCIASVNGSFGEVARAYWWELLFPSIGARKPLDAERVARARYGAHEPAARAALDRLLFPGDGPFDPVAHFKGVVERATSGLGELPNTAQLDHAYLTLRMQRWQGRIASTLNQLWPCISPCIFREVLETMLGARARFRLRSLLVRSTLAELNPRLASHPLEHGHPALPFAWTTAHRFAPLIGHYGRRVVRKAGGKLGLRRPAAKSPSAEAPRLQLWREEAVREVLRPESMRLAGSTRPDALREFLTASAQPSFAFAEEWGRLLTVEMALRAVAEARAR